MRVLVLTNIPAPYRYPAYNLLARQFDLEVTYLTATERNRPYFPRRTAEFGETCLGVKALDMSDWGGPVLHWPGGPLRYLRELSPDVLVVAGYGSPALLAAIVHARMVRLPFVLWIESTENEYPIAKAIASPILGSVVRAASAIVVPGTRARKYVENLGAKHPDVFIAPNSIDVEQYHKRVVTKKDGFVRREHAQPTETRILFVGQLIRRKGVDVLLRACAELKRLHSRHTLRIVGDGPERGGLLRLQSDLGLDSVCWLGTLTDDEVCDEYARADLFVLPSHREVWGFVLNEATAAGLPIIASDSVGAVPDLLVEEFNGLTYPDGDHRALARAIGRLTTDHGLRNQMAMNSWRLASTQFTPMRMADGLAGAISHAYRGGHPQAPPRVQDASPKPAPGAAPLTGNEGDLRWR